MGEALKRRIAQTKFESPIQEATLNLLVAADCLRKQIEAICTPAGISIGQYNVLRILRGAHPDGHSRAEILRRMLERAPDVTRLVDRLEKEGLAERDRSQADRRLSLTRITAKGLNLLKTLEPAVQESQRLMGRRVGRRDCLELSRICERIYEEES
jgi:DNA-binding MarR family transcriptional regulator